MSLNERIFDEIRDDNKLLPRARHTLVPGERLTNFGLTFLFFRSFSSAYFACAHMIFWLPSGPTFISFLLWMIPFFHSCRVFLHADATEFGKCLAGTLLASIDVDARRSPAP